MGAALEFVESGRNGWLIRAGDQEALLDTMRAAATLTLDEMRCQARESVGGHTLRSGAMRFVEYAQRVISQW
jgi:hypothetical protein